MDADTGIGGPLGQFPSTQLSLLQAATTGLSNEALDRVIALYANVDTLDYCRKLLADPSLLRRPSGGTVTAVWTRVDPALFPLLNKLRLLPAGAAGMSPGDLSLRPCAVGVSSNRPTPISRPPASSS